MIDSVLRDPYLRALYDTAFSSITNYLPEERNTLIEIGAGDGLSKQFLPKAFLTDIAFPSASKTAEYLVNIAIPGPIIA